MNQEEKQRLVQRMRSALKEAREERKMDRSILSHYLGEALHGGDHETAAKAIDEASGRRMLHKAIVTRHGKLMIQEVAAVKEREPYEKRPSVRAVKKSKDTGAGL